MKRFLILILTLCLFPLCSYAEDGRYMVLTGIYWDDTLEKVQSYYGKGSVQDFGNKKMLVYENQTFAGHDDVDFHFNFEDDRLKTMWFLVYFDKPIGDLFLEYFIDANGEPIRTDYESIVYRTFEEKADGDYYLWFIEEDTILYVSVFPSSIHVEFEQYLKGE